MSLFNNAVSCITSAMRLDRDEKYIEAFDEYVLGLGHFLVILKYETCPEKRTVLSKRILEYMQRAEVLNDFVKKKEEPKQDSFTTEVKVTNFRTEFKASQVRLSDVAGLVEIKRLLNEAIVLPKKFPVFFLGTNRQASKAILMYGPAGTGKSLIAEAIANESDAFFFNIKSSDLVTKYQGESERQVKSLFETARCQSKQSIIFFDEIDSLCSSRSDNDDDSIRRIKTEFLVQMQGVGKNNDNILILATTNTPWDLDPGIRRRFDKRIFVPLPDEKTREIIFKTSAGSFGKNICFKQLAAKTEGYSGADINTLVNDALLIPVRELLRASCFRKNESSNFEACNENDDGALKIGLFGIDPRYLEAPQVTKRHFEIAFACSKKTVAEKDLFKYETWYKTYGTRA